MGINPRVLDWTESDLGVAGSAWLHAGQRRGTNRTAPWVDGWASVGFDELTRRFDSTLVEKRVCPQKRYFRPLSNPWGIAATDEIHRLPQPRPPNGWEVMKGRSSSDRLHG